MTNYARRIGQILNPLWASPLGELCMWLISHGQGAMYRALSDQILKLGGDQILDVGCGSGHSAVLLGSDRPMAHITGLDLSPQLIATARGRATRAGIVNTTFVVGNAMALPFAQQRFDAAYSINSIKHWPDPAAGLLELHRVLQPGGRLAIFELERGATRERILDFAIEPPLSLVPAPLFAATYRAVTASGAFDLEQARALLQTTPFVNVQIQRFPRFPLIFINAEKAS